mmetsp:Transcript_45970/g.127623  ORF Transcript_45970/g.127623 Transcript_45970/m.127623 type:complete len:249 (-) Transcript_45970:267-1013(-)
MWTWRREDRRGNSWRRWTAFSSSTSELAWRCAVGSTRPTRGEGPDSWTTPRSPRSPRIRSLWRTRDGRASGTSLCCGRATASAAPSHCANGTTVPRVPPWRLVQASRPRRPRSCGVPLKRRLRRRLRPQPTSRNSCCKPTPMESAWPHSRRRLTPSWSAWQLPPRCRLQWGASIERMSASTGRFWSSCKRWPIPSGRDCGRGVACTIRKFVSGTSLRTESASACRSSDDHMRAGRRDCQRAGRLALVG